MDHAFGQARPGGDQMDAAAPSLPASARLSLLPSELAPGAALSDSPAAPDERAIYVLQGQGEARLDGRLHALIAGSVLRLPPGVRFGLRNTMAEQPLVFLTAAPPAPAFAVTEGALAPLANRLAWLLRRIARRLAR
jgi:quercetin dioxygenase-like cupin family protein